ncbi:hypothetical protein ABZ791_36450 [Streptomyces huasconensis]|uniref:Uncharacterized protein n=1 Tax=Streptomyces huasconensis TaxID=1854574 RepID=A0ABV3M5V3_9ACTN
MASDWVVAATALITGAAGSFGTFSTIRTAKDQARQRAEAELEQLKETSERQHHADRQERFAAFQMHKRAVYSALLEAGQAASQGSDWSKHVARALVVAEGPLRGELLQLRDAQLPLHGDSLWALIEKIQADVDTES